jgi:hypothetical protein
MAKDSRRPATMREAANWRSWSARRAEVSVAVPTNGDIRAQDFDAAGKAGCSIGGVSTAVVSISSPLLIAR